MEISVLSQANPFSACKGSSQHLKPTSFFSLRSFQALQGGVEAQQLAFWQHSVVVGSAFDLGHATVPHLIVNERSWARSSNSSRGRGTKNIYKIGPRHVCKALGEDRDSPESPDENEAKPPEEESISKSAEDTGCNSDKNDAFSVEDVECSASTDWRTFRARLISLEHLANSNSEVAGGSSQERREKKAADGSWAHPILKPEPGCVLIATEKLDGLSIFERTVILLLSDGLNGSSDGPFGLILNRPLPHTVKDMRPNDLALIEAFGNSQVHFGGPLVSDLILLYHGRNQAKGYQEVIPGVYFSPAEGLESAAEMVREEKSHPEDTRFFFGYAGWAINQLKDETDNQYWYVAACSTDLFMLPSTVNLWKEILCMMGGEYAELSKKPKRRLQ